ncbi:hypothetical protein FNYG_10499 [Fusarium nygamai]|uniref:Uncharacterized protein n=1 Tax=Gibberella nygamai TaxID=42673 RepID=A0A2K0W1R6_GIBNY|nr:hypothetical protein FNYG_10499 [Fusarium nygamai]
MYLGQSLSGTKNADGRAATQAKSCVFSMPGFTTKRSRTQLNATMTSILSAGSEPGGDGLCISSDHDTSNLCLHCNVSHTGFISCFHYQITAYLMEAHTRLNHSSTPPGLSFEIDHESFLGDAEEEMPNPPLQSLLRLGHSDTAAMILSQRHSEMPEIADRMATLILMYRLLKAGVIFFSYFFFFFFFFFFYFLKRLASVQIWSF